MGVGDTRPTPPERRPDETLDRPALAGRLL